MTERFYRSRAARFRWIGAVGNRPDVLHASYFRNARGPSRWKGVLPEQGQTGFSGFGEIPSIGVAMACEFARAFLAVFPAEWRNERKQDSEGEGDCGKAIPKGEELCARPHRCCELLARHCGGGCGGEAAILQSLSEECKRFHRLPVRLVNEGLHRVGVEGAGALLQAAADRMATPARRRSVSQEGGGGGYEGEHVLGRLPHRAAGAGGGHDGGDARAARGRRQRPLRRTAWRPSIFE